MNLLAARVSGLTHGLTPWIIGVVALAAIAGVLASLAVRRRSRATREDAGAPPLAAGKRATPEAAPVDRPARAEDVAPATPSGPDDSTGDAALEVAHDEEAEPSSDTGQIPSSDTIVADFSSPRFRRAMRFGQTSSTAPKGLGFVPASETVPTSPTVPVWRAQVTTWRQRTKAEPIPAPPEVPDDSTPSTQPRGELLRESSSFRIPPPPSVP